MSRKKNKKLPPKFEAKIEPRPKNRIWSLLIGSFLIAGLLLLAVFLLPFPGDRNSSDSADSVRSGRDFSFEEPVETKLSLDLPTEVHHEGRAVEQGKLLDAIALITSRYPDDRLVYHIAGIVLVEASQFEKAIEKLERAVSLDPSQIEPVLMLADAYAKSGMQEKALQTLENPVAGGLATASVYLALGDTLMQLGRTDDAIQNLEKSRNLDFKNARTHRYLLQVYMDAERYEDAEKSAGMAVQLGSREASTYTLWALALAKQGRADEAKQVRGQVPRYQEESKQDNDSLEQSFLEATSHHYAMLGNVCSANKAFQEAEAYLLEALRFDPQSKLGTGLLAETLNRQGKSLDCIAVLKRLISIESDNVVHYWNLASLAMANRNVALAEKTLLQATEMDSSGTSDLLMAQLLMNLRKSENLVKYARLAVNRLGTVDAYLVLVSALEATGEQNAARLELLKARKIAPNDPRLAG